MLQKFTSNKQWLLSDNFINVHFQMGRCAAFYYQQNITSNKTTSTVLIVFKEKYSDSLLYDGFTLDKKTWHNRDLKSPL